MSMSTHIIGFRPPDKKWKEMKKVYDACIEARLEIPKEVDEFFGGEEPDESGVMLEIEEDEAVEEWSDDMRQGFQVDVTKLPKDLKYIRFYNSW